MENKLKIILEAIHKTRGEDIIIYDFTSLNPNSGHANNSRPNAIISS